MQLSKAETQQSRDPASYIPNYKNIFYSKIKIYICASTDTIYSLHHYITYREGNTSLRYTIN